MPGQPPAEAPFDALAQCGERLLLIGGNAVLAYGSPRVTFDCDCAVIAEDEKLVAAVLEPLGYLFKERFDSFSRYAHLGGRRPVVDVMLLNSSTFQSLYAASREVILSGVALRAPKPLHLVALKMFALKNNPSRTGKDWEDIQFLLTNTEWTRDELAELAQRYASEDTLLMLRGAGFL
jgi:hypothetical protein